MSKSTGENRREIMETQDRVGEAMVCQGRRNGLRTDFGQLIDQDEATE